MSHDVLFVVSVSVSRSGESGCEGEPSEPDSACPQSAGGSAAGARAGLRSRLPPRTLRSDHGQDAQRYDGLITCSASSEVYMLLKISGHNQITRRLLAADSVLSRPMKLRLRHEVVQQKAVCLTHTHTQVTHRVCVCVLNNQSL